MTKLTPKELDERISKMVDEFYDVEPAHIKQLIRDCIEAVTPSESDAVKVASDEDERRGFMIAKFAYLEAIDTIQENTKDLLG